MPFTTTVAPGLATAIQQIGFPTTALTLPSVVACLFATAGRRIRPETPWPPGSARLSRLGVDRSATSSSQRRRPVRGWSLLAVWRCIAHHLSTRKRRIAFLGLEMRADRLAMHELLPGRRRAPRTRQATGPRGPRQATGPRGPRQATDPGRRRAARTPAGDGPAVTAVDGPADDRQPAAPAGDGRRQVS
jgi:hypothetical protein